MRHRTLKLGLAAATVMGFLLPLTIAIQPAYADYSPGKGDIVGVGSDTLQFMLDFMADGDAYGTAGYNTIGNKYKLVSIDATADANARLAYGVDGGQSTQTTCTPGTGSTAGTGNSNTSNSGTPCVLNPTVVLRAGLQPVQRPNGSGAGFKALVQDMVAGHNGLPGGPAEVINFSRASAAQTTTATLPAGVDIDQLQVASDTLPILTANPAGGNNAFPLSPSQLSIIYGADTGSCIAWNDPRISGVYMEGATVSGSTVTWTEPTGDTQVPTTSNENTWDVVVVGTGATLGTGTTTVNNVTNVGSTYTLTLSQAAASGGTANIGLVNPSASSDAIIPIIPQVGSGTRSFFLSQLVPPPTVGTCTVVAEENDPTAVYDVVAGSATLEKDTIEPISQGRLDVYEGEEQGGAKNTNLPSGYLLDPSCAYLSGASLCGNGSVSGGTWITNSVTPQVEAWNSAADTPVGLGAYTGTGAGGGLFNPTRPLYLYFRNSDIKSTTAWQPGSTENWLNTLFYDPCEPGQTCTGQGGIYGPDGAPYIETGAGAQALADAGVLLLSPEVCLDITTDTSC